MDWNNELELAKQAAMAASEQIKHVIRNDILDESGRDLKHRADMEAEQAILAILSHSSSAYPILAEESGEIREIRRDTPIWVVDPLDGTFNFSRNIGLCCVSIALWQDDQPIIGVVYDFNRKELFSGIVGQGAWCNEQPISASHVTLPEKAALATGFPVNRDFGSGPIRDFLLRVQQFKKIRLFGSAALSLSYTACGRVDAYTEEDIMFWDVAAGVALVRAANGFVLTENSEKGGWMRNVRAGSVFEQGNKLG